MNYDSGPAWCDRADRAGARKRVPARKPLARPSQEADAMDRRTSISTGTFVRAVIAVALVAAWLRLWPWVLVALIGVALAISVDPAVRWLEARGVRRPFGAPAVVLSGSAVAIAFLVLSAAALRDDAQLLERRLTEVSAAWLESLPPSAQPIVGSFTPSSEAFLAAGRAAVGGLAALGVALALAVYFLVDGRRTYEWMLAFAPEERRAQVRETAEGARQAIAAYALGNLMTSAMAALATWIVLLVLGVPAALLLAILAGLCNLLPVVGIFISAAPAVLLALTVSPTTAVTVAAFFLFYNLVENYYIQPKVYGRAMRLSDLAVIASFLVGAELGGILGALVALPIAATYPVIERVWLRGTEREDLARAHARIEALPEH
jgi:predicted PurR-regulated permease PerM